MRGLRSSVVGGAMVGLLAMGVVPVTSATASPQQDVIPQTVNVPSAPPQVIGIVKDDSVDAMWDYPTNPGGVLTFQATLDTKTGNTVDTCDADNSVNQCSLKGLAKDTDYRISVTATNSAGMSPAATWDFTTRPYVWEKPQPVEPTNPVNPVTPKPVTKKYTSSVRARVVKQRVKIDPKRTSKARSFVLQRKAKKKWVTVRKGGIKTVHNRKVKKGAHRLTMVKKGNYPAAAISKLTKKWRTVKKTRTVTTRSSRISTRGAVSSPQVGAMNLPPTPVAPTAPRTPSAIAGNNVIGVTWTPPTSPGQPAVLNSYTATATSGGQTRTCTIPAQHNPSNPGCTINDTANGQNWTITIKATNAFGDSPNLSVPGTYRPVGAPSTPTDVEPVRVAGKTFTDISNSAGTTCAIADGQAYCWGYNNGGQLGNGSGTYTSNVPVAVDTSGVLNGKTVTDISTGGAGGTTCAVADGQAYCWGASWFGQLGNGSGYYSNDNDSYVPVAVSTAGVLNGKTVTNISSNNYSTCAIADGQVYCWGDNSNGQLGNNSTTLSNIPVAVNTAGVLNGKTITDISVGESHACAIADGEAFCWGRNNYGQLGNNSTTQSNIPVAVNTAGVLNGKTITNISTGTYYSCAVAATEAYCWGRNNYGQLGNNSTTQSNIPVAVNTAGTLNGKTVTQITGNRYTTCAIADNQAHCWGLNTYGQLGNNSTTQSNVPVAVNTTGVLNGKNVTSISSGESTCTTADGEAFCWGRNNYGQLGNGTTTNSLTPVAVNSEATVYAPINEITGGLFNACQIITGEVYCWGRNTNGQLGNNSTTDSSVPVKVNTTGVLNGKTVTKISTGGGSSCAVAEGEAYCWGANIRGQLGNGTTTDSSVPVKVNTTGVLNGKTVTDISVGTLSTCAVAEGEAYCWGYNLYGQLGNNSTTDSSVPVKVNTSGVLNGKTVTTVSLRQQAACAIADGQAYCWGPNTVGQLGNGTTTNSSVPVAVSTTGALDEKTVTDISVGVYGACVTANSEAYCWGKNQYGQLGDGTTTDSSVPVKVNTSGVLNGKTVIDISAGTFSACVVADNRVYCWGGVGSGYGLLGNGTVGGSLVPEAVNTSGVLNGELMTKVSITGQSVCSTSVYNTYCWGSGAYGQLGNNSTASTNLPAQALTAANYSIPVGTENLTPSATVSWTAPANNGGSTSSTFTYFVYVTVDNVTTVYDAGSGTSFTLPSNNVSTPNTVWVQMVARNSEGRMSGLTPIQPVPYAS